MYELRYSKGEMKPKLEVELVPSTCWFSNLRSVLEPIQWNVVRRRCYRNAKYKCEICGGKGKKWPVECHEVWEYNDLKNIQRLVRTIALCPDCHEVKHIGRASATNHLARALKHLYKVNQWTLQEAKNHVDVAFIVWEKRSQEQWTLDVSWVKENFGLDIGTPKGT